MDAGLAVARTELAAADGNIQQAQGSLQQALDELATKQEIMQVVAEGRKGAVDAAVANKETLQANITALLPA